MSSSLRETIDKRIEEKDHGGALAALRQYFRETPTLAGAQYVLGSLKKIEAPLPSQPLRVAFLRSFTIEPAIPLLRAAAALHGIDITAHVGGFGTYAQDILDPASALYAFDPQIVVLAVQARDLAPDLWRRFADLSQADIQANIDQAAGALASLITSFRSRSRAHLIVHNLEMPIEPSNGILDSQVAEGQCRAIRRINESLQSAAAAQPGVYVLDYDSLVARHGRARWHDELKWLTARMPIAADCLIHLAQEYLRFVLPLTGRVCKALAIDLDNTLWGGVIGEDGIEGIKIGAEYPGAAHLALQRAILDLYRRGIILAVASKNNHEDAVEALANHPDMLLRPEHFACLRINWTDKAQNLREIAKELNIGLDAVAFIDDNPVERQRIQSELPEVTVIDMPEDPMAYADTLRACPVFERLALSEEDRERGRLYAEQRQRAELESSACTIEDFYRSLQMEMEIAPVSPQTLARVAQLTQKTNQFNMTTRRYSEQEIEELSRDPGSRVIAVRVKDRFGDNGLVGVVITRTDKDAHEIDTFLMSCRVIGRTIETAILAHLIQAARSEGMRALRGWFLPTKKNIPAKDFYSAHGFRPIEENDYGTLWEVDLADTAIACPEWIACRVESGLAK